MGSIQIAADFDFGIGVALLHIAFQFTAQAVQSLTVGIKAAAGVAGDAVPRAAQQRGDGLMLAFSLQVPQGNVNTADGT